MSHKYGESPQAMAGGSGVDRVRLPAPARSAARLSQAGPVGMGAAGEAGVSQPALRGSRLSSTHGELARGTTHIAPQVAALTGSAGDGANGRRPSGAPRIAAAGDRRGARRNTQGGLDSGRSGPPGGFRR